MVCELCGSRIQRVVVDETHHFCCEGCKMVWEFFMQEDGSLLELLGEVQRPQH